MDKMTDQERRKAEILAKKEKLRKMREGNKTPHDPTSIANKIIQQQQIDKLSPQKPDIKPSSNSSIQPQEVQQQQQPAKKAVKLTFESYVGEVQIGYSEKIMVDAESQCTPAPEQSQNNNQDHDQEQSDQLPSKHQLNNSQVLHHKEEQNQQAQQQQQQAPSIINKELTQEDIEQITKSPEFIDFFTKSTKLMEKALEAKSVELLEDKFDEIVQNENFDKNVPLHLEHKFFDQQYCSNRVVTGLQWSPNQPEVFLASYSQNEEGNINDHVGVVLVWSQSLKQRPEFYCFCPSQITSACFYPYNNNLVIGGCYNGQIVIWDLRAKTLPVQRSTQEGHAYPIYSLNVVGTQNAHKIVSISNDGTLCTWNMNMLNQPQSKQSIKEKDSEVNVTVMNFKENESNNFYIGCEDGVFHSAQLHSNTDSLVQNTYMGHQAPISAISQNNISDNSHYLQNLLLTSSFDWTVKLWNPSVSQQCLYTFENNEDYIYDVQWNKQNPCMFATADGEGYIDIWDLQEDLEMPVGRYLSATQNSINKIAWNSTGEKLIAGDSKGNIDLYGLQKKFLKYDPSRIHEIENILMSNIQDN